MTATLDTPRRGRGKSAGSLALIEAARSILEQIQPASVRAVCYQLFIAKMIDSMGRNDTNRVSSQLTWAREEGVIPWEWIVDDTRRIQRLSSWSSPEDILEAAATTYRRDWWEQQPVRLILASEKSTVAGTVRPVTDNYGVGFLSLHGYSSATTAHDLADLSTEDERPLIVLYIGDWDPSGLHMSSVDLPGRVERYGGRADVRRIALATEDVETLGPSLSFSVDEKTRDPRHRWFVERFGGSCWELDAMAPDVLRDIVDGAIQRYIDWREWDRCKRVEEVQRDSLQDVVTAWKKAHQ